MARITREQAEEIAKKQLSRKIKAISDRIVTLTDIALKIRIDKLPEDVRDVYIKYKDSKGNLNT